MLQKLKPVHLLMIRLFWSGQTLAEIASKVGYTPQQVMNVVHSDHAKDILQQLQSAAIDSMEEVQDRINEAAPELLNKKLQHALYSSDEKVSNRACTELLHMAGHVPVQRVKIEREDAVSKKYEGLTEDELRNKLLDSIRDKGPDGRPLQ
jgi:predicted transcriptional regulator